MDNLNQDVIRYLRQYSEGEQEIILENPPSFLGYFKEIDSRMTGMADLQRRTSTCKLCQLSETRQNVVFGTGNPNADLMFIGEGLGADEDRLGEPFVGRAGKLLDKIIAAMKMERQDVYIANIVKCRPPSNRNPLPQEAATCLPYLKEQIELVDPAVVVALGLVAAVNLLGLQPNVSVKSLRERILDYKGRPMVVTYHPAALLRTPSLKAPTWADMQVVMKLLSGEIVHRPDSLALDN